MTADQNDRWNFKRPFQAFSDRIFRYRHALSSKMSPKRKNTVNLSERHHPAQSPWLSGLASTSNSPAREITEVDKFYRVCYPINPTTRDESQHNEKWQPKVNQQQQFRSTWNSVDGRDSFPKVFILEDMTGKNFWPENKLTGYRTPKPDRNSELMAQEHFRLRCEMLMDPYDCIYSSHLNRMKYKY